MIMEKLNEYMETLAGYVFDNDKLVTYKWLSKELQIHVNLAKQILLEFYEKYHKDNIECTYLLIGHLKDNGMRMEVVKESALSKAKEKFNKIISEHLYSVHKPLDDLNLLASEFSGAGDVNYSAIKCDACKERSDEEMQLLRWGTAAKKFTTQNVNSKPVDLVNSSKSEKNSVAIKKNKFNNFFNVPEKSRKPEELKSCQEKNESLMEKNKNFLKEKDAMKINDCLMEKNETSVDTVKKSIDEEKDTMKNGKDSLGEDKVLAKDKSSEKIKNSTKKKEDYKVNSKKIAPKSSNSAKKEGLDNFFKKLTSPPKPAEVVSSEEKSDKVKKTFSEKGKTKEKNNSRGKKRNRSKETSESAKKRKRVFVQSDSSESEAQSDVEMEESILEPEPEPLAKAKSPSPPRIKHENGKRKMLKLVNKTYKEGDYIVTKKEHVYVSCSEDEEEKKEEEKRKNVKKVESKMEKLKKKQSTLTDFFKKS